jgi:Zn-dependent peptidase ImmA (M78 family)
MKRTEYYEDLKILAQNVRAEFNLETPRVLRSDLRRIYKHYGIQIDLWPRNESTTSIKLKGLRGAFFYDEYDPSVLLNRHLPEEPRIFTMGHELKHYLKDRNYLDSNNGVIWCGDDNQNEVIEIGAEVFAAELIFPDNDFKGLLTQMDIQMGKCQPETLVHLKYKTQTTLSYTGLVKKAVFLEFASQGDFSKIKWKKLEESIYGLPLYKKLRRSS